METATKSFQIECRTVDWKPERMDFVYSFLWGIIPTFQVPATQAFFDLKGFPASCYKISFPTFSTTWVWSVS